ncbi:hypothetical protein CHS0354_026037 [Potamilus streckersoni]|uniref:Uncharacterized protein n=1 Tax=Potamilus streckersoni TaxID=2493646 RepID=A0AAE0VS83_9BIVA|nr:hypothetical protein CHS0354_026037 [Potamilus streckersoni]
MAGKVIIVTGANTGLGFLSAQILCREGHEVILACRNEEKGKAAVERIIRENQNAKATYMNLDVACFASIRQFVDEFHKKGKKLDILINNAGLLAADKTTKHYTVDNFELTIGTNHLGPFLLTTLLLDDLKSSGLQNSEARIVVLTSMIHDPQKAKMFGVKSLLDPEDFFLGQEEKL